MEGTTLQHMFVEILAAELNGTELDARVKNALVADADAVSALYILSKKHDLAHIVAAGLNRAGVPAPAESKAKLQKEAFLALFRLEQMKYAYAQICHALEEAKIPYIPLKGSVLRPYYPTESMRTSCDIDILVKEEELDAAVAALTAVGYVIEERNYHDISLRSPENVHLELHFSILEKIDRLDRVLATVWAHALPAEGCRYELTPDFFAFYLLAHMSYHFLSGGCGMRSLMDLWVIKHRMGIELTTAHALLCEADLCEFAAEMERLADVCFSAQPRDDFSELLLAYIISGGVYGSLENGVAIRVTEPGGRFGYIMKRLFPPYRDMKFRYSAVRRVPLLLPVFWMVRLFEKLFQKKTKRALAEWRTADTMSDAQIHTAKMIQQRLNL